MTLEELIYERFANYAFLKDHMAVYAGVPAVFYQIAPDDRQEVWKGAQYPRIIYTLDMRQIKKEKAPVSCR